MDPIYGAGARLSSEFKHGIVSYCPRRGTVYNAETRQEYAKTTADHIVRIDHRTHGLNIYDKRRRDFKPILKLPDGEKVVVGNELTKNDLIAKASWSSLGSYYGAKTVELAAGAVTAGVAASATGYAIGATASHIPVCLRQGDPGAASAELLERITKLVNPNIFPSGDVVEPAAGVLAASATESLVANTQTPLAQSTRVIDFPIDNLMIHFQKPIMPLFDGPSQAAVPVPRTFIDVPAMDYLAVPQGPLSPGELKPPAPYVPGSGKGPPLPPISRDDFLGASDTAVDAMAGAAGVGIGVALIPILGPAGPVLGPVIGAGIGAGVIGIGRLIRGR